MTQAHKQITTAEPETVTEPLIPLYREWQIARQLTEAAQGDDATDAASDREEALAEQIAATPPRTVVGVIIKAQLAESLICESSPGHAPRDLPERLAVNTMRDARRFLSRLETEPAPFLPPSDALAEAERAVARRYAEIAAADAETAEDIGPNDLCYTASDFIAETPPASLADVAVKLRRMCDATVGMISGHNRGDLVSLLQILAFVEGLAGAPTYPTRRIVTIEEIEREDGAELAATTTAEAAPSRTAEDREAMLVAGFREMIAANTDPVLSLCRQFAEANSECEAIERQGDGLVGISPESVAHETALAVAMARREAIARKIIATGATTPAGALSLVLCLEPYVALAAHSLVPMLRDLAAAAIASAKRFAA